ncbi:hypothetical protein I3842_09G092900 [Carya illinoinensis]|uniref:Uncharacterized protein n=1 Tax=Carya illinoinensis TaxID=32201 RepID=A0A922E259_CARIL|nr:hypothetical protein I3842_09G092900 [Carya illinoinensis]
MKNTFSFFKQYFNYFFSQRPERLSLLFLFLCSLSLLLFFLHPRTPLSPSFSFLFSLHRRTLSIAECSPSPNGSLFFSSSLSIRTALSSSLRTHFTPLSLAALFSLLDAHNFLVVSSSTAASSLAHGSALHGFLSVQFIEALIWVFSLGFTCL